MHRWGEEIKPEFSFIAKGIMKLIITWNCQIRSGSNIDDGLDLVTKLICKCFFIDLGVSRN